MSNKRERLQAAAKATQVGITARLSEITKKPSGRIPLEDIEPDPNQPRRSFAATAQQAFDASIAERGVLQPILVRRHGSKYRIVAGERRYRASLKAGHDDIPALIRDDLPAEITLELQLEENLLREGLNDVDRVEGILRLMVLRSDSDFESITRDIATRYRDRTATSDVSAVVDKTLEQFEISLSTFQRFHLRILKLPTDLLEAVRTDRLEYSLALVLQSVADVDDRARWIDRIEQEGLSRLELERLLRTEAAPAQPSAPKEIVKRLTTIRRSVDKLGSNKSLAKWVDQQLEHIHEVIKQGRPPS
jgi:ParB family transcriptional regulator, chromosome partitioning protein